LLLKTPVESGPREQLTTSAPIVRVAVPLLSVS
jgi:hypothetical protein